MSLLQSRLQGLRREALKVEDHMVPVPPVSGKQRVWREIKDRVMQEAVDVLDIETMEKMSGDERDGYLKEQIGVLVSQTLQDLDATLTRTDSLRMVDEIVSEITGYGPITPLLADHSVNEVMVNGPNQIYVERKGKIELTNITFRDDGHVMHLIHRIVAPLGNGLMKSHLW